MRYKLLGNSGLRVSELALGTMTFGEQNADGVADKSVSRQLFDAFIEAGGNFIDTANDYTGGTSETHLGEFIASTGERDRFIVATKYTANMRPDDPNGGGNSRKSMVQSVEASLKRLQTNYIDLLWVHYVGFGNLDRGSHARARCTDSLRKSIVYRCVRPPRMGRFPSKQSC